MVMKAFAKTKSGFGGEVIELPVPRPNAGELLVRIAACGICGSDLHLYEWELGAERMVGRLPFVMGHEPAGVVEAVGPGVTRFKAGDRVALDPFGHCGQCGPCRAGRFNLCSSPTTLSGAFAEYTIAPIGNSHLVPPTMDLEHAALLEAFGTGLHAVEQSSLKAGDCAVVEGPGPIGLSVAMAARAFGAGPIVMTGLDIDTDRLALARRLGFTTVCASDEGWTSHVRKLLPPDGADVLFDASGAIDSPRELLRRGGQFVEIGWPARDITGTELRALFFHGVQWINSRVRTPETWRRAIALVASGEIDLMPMVTHRYDLSRAVEAFELLRERKGVKAIVVPNA